MKRKKKKKADALTLMMKFLNRGCNSNDRLYLGVDPGAKGAIAVQLGHNYLTVNIPTLKVSRGRKKKIVFNEPAVIDLFKLIRSHCKRLPKHAVIEEAQMFGKGGAYVAFRTGYSFGLWPLFLMGQGFSVEVVRPSIWKKVMGLHKQDKEASRHKCLNLFPKADVKLVKDHDKAEALLLSEYLRRSMNR